MRSRYICYVCGIEANPESKLTLRYVRGWARSTGKTLAIVDQEDHKFVHETCLGVNTVDDQLPLF